MKLLVTNDFIEPWIQVDETNFENILNRLIFLHFKGAIFENISRAELDHLKDRIVIEDEFLLFNRRTIESSKKNPNDMDKIRNEFDLVCFFCTNAEITKWACQDQRIDCLTFQLSEIHLLVDDSTVNLAKNQDKAIEIDFSELLLKKNPISSLRNIKKVMHRAARKNLPVIFSSRARNVFNLRSVYSLIGFLEFIDVKSNYYDEISQKWLYERLIRNQIRKKEFFLAPGIWIKNNEEAN